MGPATTFTEWGAGAPCQNHNNNYNFRLHTYLYDTFMHTYVYVFINVQHHYYMVEYSHRLELKGLKHYPLAPFMVCVCGDNSADYGFWPNDRNFPHV